MRLSLPVAAVLLGACLIAAPALAAPAGAIKDFALPAQFGNGAPVIKVQRNLASGPGISGPNRHGGGNRGGDRGGHRGGGDDGGAVAAGVLGGLLLGTIIANEAQRNQSANYCAQRYRSYDPRSGTFVGRNGRRYRCP